MKKYGILIAGAIAGTLIALLALWVTLPVISVHFVDGVLHFIGWGILVALIGSLAFKESIGQRLVKTGAVLFTLGTVIVLGGLLISSSIFHWETKKNMLVVENKEFNQSVSSVDMSNLVILDEQDAIKFSEKLITEKDSALGSVYGISEEYGTLSVVNGKPYWIFPLEHSGFFKWLSNKEIPGYIMVNATTGNSKFVDKPFQYAPSAYLGNDLKRMVYFKYMNIGLTDYSFEVDENGTPMWVITAYTHKTGISTKQVLGSIIVNATSGQTNFYEVGKQPLWVDRIFSLSIFEDQLNDWGKYINGWWNPSDTGKLQNTEGFGYVYNDGNIYFYTGVTSYGADEATTGFIIFNPRTGIAEYNRISGSTETKAIGLMEELVQNAGYTAKYPYLLNINGVATYFSTLKGNSGNVVGYAFASVQNYRSVAWGKTLKEAQTNYSRSLLREGSANTLGAQTDEALTATGIISRVGITTESYYLLKLEAQEAVFILSSEQFPLVALSKEGDLVTLKYLTTDEKKLIDVIDFSNGSIK